MAYQDTHTIHTDDLPHSALAVVKRAFSAIGHALVAVSVANRRHQLFEELSAKSDEELAKIGIRREDIVRKVFHDMLDV